MPNVGRAAVRGAGGAGQGALAGAAAGSILGLPGAAVGAGLGFLTGFIGDLFSPDAEEIFNERKAMALAKLNEAYRAASERAGRQAMTNAAVAAQAAGRQAQAQGREVQPSEVAAGRGIALAQGQRTLENLDTQRLADIAKLETEAAFNAPTEPGVGEYVTELGSQAVNYALTQRLLDAYTQGTEDIAGAEPDFTVAEPTSQDALRGGTVFSPGVSVQMGEAPTGVGTPGMAPISQRPEDQGLFGDLQGRANARSINAPLTDFNFKRRLQGTLAGYGR